jgi:hypothetical protein
MYKNIKVEAEHNELILENSHGDKVIIPANKRNWVKQKLSEGCHDCIDSLVETLPVADEYAQDGTVIPKKGKEDVEHWKNVYKNNKRLPQYVWNYYTPQEQIKYFGTTKENNISNIKGLTVFNSLLKNKTAYGNFASGDASVAVNNKDYFEITNLYKSGKIKRAEYLDKLYSNAINTSDDSKYIHKGGSNPPVRPLNINSSQDALNIFLGKPQEYDSFSISNYKPSNSKNSDSYYYKLNREEEIENELFNTSKNVLTGEDNFLNSKETERYVKGSHLGEASLKNFKLSKGKDERGDYVSYYDINDYGNVLDIAGKPFEIYNRIYLKDYGDGKQKKMYYSDKELSELNTDKKDFDTLGLQRELSNRGYKLPNSTKQDGSFDGIWGDETKNALLEYRKSQNKSEQ